MFVGGLGGALLVLRVSSSLGIAVVLIVLCLVAVMGTPLSRTNGHGSARPGSPDHVRFSSGVEPRWGGTPGSRCRAVPASWGAEWAAGRDDSRGAIAILDHPVVRGERVRSGPWLPHRSHRRSQAHGRDVPSPLPDRVLIARRTSATMRVGCPPQRILADFPPHVRPHRGPAPGQSRLQRILGSAGGLNRERREFTPDQARRTVGSDWSPSRKRGSDQRKHRGAGWTRTTGLRIMSPLL